MPVFWLFFLAFGTSSLLGRATSAAPCCSGGAVAPSIISGDDRTQISFLTSLSSVIGNAPSQGIPIFWSDRDQETFQTFRIDGATLLSDRFQIGASLPFISHSLNYGPTSGDASGFGDARLNLAYEALPEWNYSRFMPKGYVFIQWTLPTGRSLLESVVPGGVDALGKGSHSLSLGAFLVKRGTSAWDFFAIPEMHLAFARDFSNGLSVGDSLGASFALGAGRSFGDLRIGLRIQPQWTSRRTTSRQSTASATTVSISDSQTLWDTGLDATYLVDDLWSVTGSYTDQTVLGPARNTLLSRSFALLLQKRWER